MNSRLLALLLSLLAACSIENRMEDMQGDLRKAQESADKLQKDLEDLTNLAIDFNTKIIQISGIATHVDDAFSDTQDDFLQGTTALGRSDMIKNLEAATTLRRKLMESARYFMAFEFHFWRGRDKYTPELRADLFSQGLQEFLSLWADHLERAPKSFVANPDPTETDANALNLMALAFTAVILNPSQARLSKTLGFPPVSMLSLIEESLKSRLWARNPNNKISELPQYVQDVLIDEDRAMSLLKIRANVSLAGAFALIYSDDVGLLDGLRLTFTNWAPRFEKMNRVQIEGAAKFTAESLRLISLLKELGQNFQINKHLLNAIKRADLTPPNTRPGNFAKDPSLEELLKVLKKVQQLE